MSSSPSETSGDNAIPLPVQLEVPTEPVEASVVAEVLPGDFKLFRPPNSSRTLPSTLANGRNAAPTTSAGPTRSQVAPAARTQAVVNKAPQAQNSQGEVQVQAGAKRDRWPETSIRIKFTDRTQLEKVFPSTNKIAAVYAFVQSCLRDDAKHLKFILYQPPKLDLKLTDPKVRDQTLAKLQLAPSSVLLLRFEDEAMNRADTSAPLSPFVLSQAVNLPQAISYPEPPAASKSDIPTMADISAFAKELKMPKWLKDLGK
ncbi:hypothetical protein HYPSUDRAFT_39418 [Hypholoma sublateritium FD-334 SS-4]|uniref:UBX domain-containing protein n=1 Tax=Hypholoma sublateritium (strain FD-334 SS-4) TaxID=945553 RepID=A0A0D2P5E3_HYPSF|nr:hypothetical protein HYPSUDRAFT_39418 [Hypholoma sublateritium FD-334 SS-4]